MASGPLIAVVDDDVSLREALTGLLSAYGYRIDAYSSGYDLLACDGLGDYRLFILDVQMPGIDGLQLQEGLLNADVKAPIIFLTSAIDPEVVGQLLVRRRRDDPLRSLTPREREVLGLMAEGRSNTAIARKLVVTDGAVEKHVKNIFTKLDLPPDDEQHRRVLAVLAYLQG